MKLSDAQKLLGTQKMMFRINGREEMAVAIETVLQALEEYQKQMDLDYVDENYISKDKIKEKIEEQTKIIDKSLEDMIDKSTGCINVSYLSKKEKEEVINKRNCLLVQRATLQQMSEELLKESEK